MAERFRNFYIDHVPYQQNAHADALASLATSLALPARTTEKVLVYSHDLYCLRFAFKENQKSIGDLQVKEALRTSTGPELRDWDSRTSTMHCTVFCLMTLKKRLPLEGKPLNSTIMRSQEHCIADRMMESSSAACHIKRLKSTQKC